MKKVAVIGAGFSGISSACFLAKAGFEVTVFEKNSSPGGRARKFEEHGYTFDMGPSWYWMPDVFESFFQQFNKTPSDFYQLERLDPSYRIFYNENETLDIPAGIRAICELFERLEPGSGNRLLTFIREAEYKYKTGICRLVYKPGLSPLELTDIDLLKGVFKLHVFRSMSSYIRKYFKHPRLIQLLEFPVLFLGASPQKTPAFYSLMNYADMVSGTWYPKGGMFQIVNGMVRLAQSLGVRFEFNSAVQKILVRADRATGLLIGNRELRYDYIMAAADYHHVEQNLLPQTHHHYSEKYWQKRIMAPSALIFYLGINKKLENLLHHNLFFDQDFALHTEQIYDVPAWPTNPLFYVCCTSKSDVTVAPIGHENVFILIPIAPGLKDDSTIRKKYFDQIMRRLEIITRQSISEHIVFYRDFAHDDFISEYNSFKGNAYGLANTLFQTANLKPSIVNKKVTNLFYTGQLTVPGPGVPSSLISGQVVASELLRQYRKSA
jgi:phytoene desaturase